MSSTNFISDDFIRSSKRLGKTKGIEQEEIPGGPLWDTLLLQDDFSFTITIEDLSVSQF